MTRTLVLTLLLAFAGAAGCAEDDPTATDGAAPTADGGADALVGGGDGGGTCNIAWSLVDVGGDNSSCKPAATDYQPTNTASDPYAACISDDNTYHQYNPSIGSVGRVAGFEKIAALLFGDGAAPSSKAFTDARVTYSEPEGLDSRVSRREDEHLPAATKKCADMDAAEIAANKDRCVGQGKIQPLLNQAFADGAAGYSPLLAAARVEAALLWFLYVSVHKEAVTCTNKLADCDSSYAYYTGGEARAAGLGLARYVRELGKQAHDRIWDGILAVRCWRDIDKVVPAKDIALRDQAIAQLDRALLRGVALIVKSRLASIKGAACDAARAAHFEVAKILGGVLDRAASARDAAQARVLRDELAKGVAGADVAAINGALDKLFDCP